MKVIPVTFNFQVDKPPIGKLSLSDEAVRLIERSPEQCITFSFDTSNSKNWKLIDAAVIPNVLLPRADYKELLDKKPAKARMSDRSQIIIIWLLALVVTLAVFLFLEWSTRP